MYNTIRVLMKRIRVFSSFCDSNNCKEVYERLCQTHLLDYYGKDLIFTSGDDYTHVVIMNIAMPTLNVPRENVIGIAFEPPQFLNLTMEFIQYASKHIGVYFIGDTRLDVGQGRIFNLPKPFVPHFGFMWHCTTSEADKARTTPRAKLMSLMVSDKGYAPGHKLRHELVKRILASNLPIDIYGRGCALYNSSDSRLKGTFSEIEPYEGYKYHIAIENFETEAYFSEKLMNPLLCGTIPIYNGCRTADAYFPNSIIRIDGYDADRAFNTIRGICSKQPEYELDSCRIKKTVNLVEFIKDWDITKRLV